MNAAMVRVLMDYNAWAHAQVWRCMENLDDAQFVADVGYSLGNLRNHLVHVVSVDGRWWSRVRMEEPPPRLVPEDYSTKAALGQLWADFAQQQAVFLEELTDADVMRQHTFTARDAERTNAAWQILLHIINHGTDHRAQMLYTLHKLGAPTVEQDFIFYLRDEMPPRGYLQLDPYVIQSLFRYDARLTAHLVLKCMSTLDDEALDRDLGYSFGTLRRQLAHVMMAQRYWLQRSSGSPVENADFQELAAALRDHITSLDATSLMAPIEYRNSRDVAYANIRWEMLYQLVNHGTDHRAQMLAMLHALGAPTFEQDIMIHFWEAGDQGQ